MHNKARHIRHTSHSRHAKNNKKKYKKNIHNKHKTAVSAASKANSGSKISSASLRFTPAGNLVIGVDVGATYVKAGLVNLGSDSAKILKFSKRLVEAELGKDASLSNILLTIKEVMPPNGKLKAIGIGFPAPVDNNGAVYEVTNMKGWEGVNVKKEIAKALKIDAAKVFAENDANCFILGEAKYGAAKGRKNVVGLTLGTGVGGGIIIDGKLYRGNTFSAGEFGRAPYKDRMLEQSVNISALRFMSLMDSLDLKKKIDDGDDFSKYIMHEYGKELGNIISIVVDFIDPEMIVMGGGLSSFFKSFEKPMAEELEKKVFKHTLKKLKITRAKLEHAGIIGAALLTHNKKQKH